MTAVVYLRDCLTVDPAWVKQFDLLYTDPPFREHVHASATSQSRGRGTRKRDLGFDSLTRADRQAVALWTSLVRRWSVVHSDVEGSNWLSLAAQARGVEYVRILP